MLDATVRNVRDVVEQAHGYCSYYSGTNQTIGPYRVNDLDGPSTHQYYDCTRSWDTRIAVALAEAAFEVDLSGHEICNHGPWRNTVRSIHAAILAEIEADREFASECKEG